MLKNVADDLHAKSKESSVFMYTKRNEKSSRAERIRHEITLTSSFVCCSSIIIVLELLFFILFSFFSYFFLRSSFRSLSVQQFECIAFTPTQKNNERIQNSELTLLPILMNINVYCESFCGIYLSFFLKCSHACFRYVYLQHIDIMIVDLIQG